MQAVIRLAHDLVDHPPPPLALATAVDITREQPGWNVVGSFLSKELGERSSTFPRPAVTSQLRAWQRIEVNPKLWYQRAQNKKSNTGEQEPKQRERDSVRAHRSRLTAQATRPFGPGRPKVHRDEYGDQKAAAAIEMRQAVAVDSLVLLSESDEAPVALNGAPNSRRLSTKPVSDRDLAILQKEPKHMTGRSCIL